MKCRSYQIEPFNYASVYSKSDGLCFDELTFCKQDAVECILGQRVDTEILLDRALDQRELKRTQLRTKRGLGERATQKRDRDSAKPTRDG